MKGDSMDDDLNIEWRDKISLLLMKYMILCTLADQLEIANLLALVVTILEQPLEKRTSFIQVVNEWALVNVEEIKNNQTGMPDVDLPPNIQKFLDRLK